MKSGLDAVLRAVSKFNLLKDVHATCLCASLLHTQFMPQRNARSCTNTRAEKEICLTKGWYLLHQLCLDGQ